jgi:hypothetical protein
MIPYFASISATHYFNSSVLFEGLVFATGLFLMTYRGYDVKDRALSIVAGVGAILLVLFPCKPAEPMIQYPYNFLMLPLDLTNILHIIGGLAFFFSLFWVIMFQFTKTSNTTPEKRRRNFVYRICAVTMVSSVVLGRVLSALLEDPTIGYFFIGESLALWSFGVAWLVKGEVLLRDGVNIKSSGSDS